jgi:hypothetical protein
MVYGKVSMMTVSKVTTPGIWIATLKDRTMVSARVTHVVVWIYERKYQDGLCVTLAAGLSFWCRLIFTYNVKIRDLNLVKNKSKEQPRLISWR